jgi:hypothetical protein
MPHFDRPGKTIGNRYHPDIFDRVTADHERLGVSQTAWMRVAVEMALEYQLTKADMDEYQRIGRVPGPVGAET